MNITNALDDKDLPQSNAGKIGGTNGSMGEATVADLDRGYTVESVTPDETPAAAICNL